MLLSRVLFDSMMRHKGRRVPHAEQETITAHRSSMPQINMIPLPVI